MLPTNQVPGPVRGMLIDEHAQITANVAAWVTRRDKFTCRSLAYTQDQATRLIPSPPRLVGLGPLVLYVSKA